MRFNLEKNLHKYFGYTSFRAGQKEIIDDLFQQKDVLGILPTGSGKSLCYQLPSIMLPGLTVVISPLISLMIDQVRETKAFHFRHVAALHSFQSPKERENILRNVSSIKLLYLSPELIQQSNVLEVLDNRQVSLFVIDEAHCISQWGHDFRPDYLRLASIINRLHNPPVLALTGTATDAIIQDIKKQLHRPHMTLHHHDAERKNIGLIIEKVDPELETKNEKLFDIVATYNEPTIIYFSNRKLTEHISEYLQSRLPDRNIAYYHGGMETESRLKVQQQFFYGQIDIICATSAFGMGINKKDIRIVIHYHLPAQIESFIQEIGRAGRDGEQSVSILLYERGDEQIPLSLINNELPQKKEIYFSLQVLYNAYKEMQQIPVNRKALEELLQLPTQKVKYLLYQFESNGMIKDNQLFYDKTLWENTMDKIVVQVEKRTEYKNNQFNLMLAYVNEKTCYRENLYRIFQQKVQKLEQQCCSHCGMDLQFLSTESTSNRDNITSNWQRQLASILGLGE